MARRGARILRVGGCTLHWIDGMLEVRESEDISWKNVVDGSMHHDSAFEDKNGHKKQQ